MAVRHTNPAPGELLGVSIDTPFLLVSEGSPLSNGLTLGAGQLPNGALHVCFRFPDTEYGNEMSDAVRAAIIRINFEWGLLVDWRPNEFEFTGDRSAPFRKRTHT